MSERPELNPDSELAERLDREHIRPPDIFQGKPLWPASKGSWLIFFQVKAQMSIGERGDSILFLALAFVYIHLNRGGAAAWEDFRKVMPLAWRVDDFRAEIAQWCDAIPDQDQAEACRIYRECDERENGTRIIAKSPPMPPGLPPSAQKKIPASPGD